MLWFFAIGWLFSVAVVAGIAVFGPFAWFGLNAVMWFGGFLAVVLGVVYFIGNMTGQFGGGGGGATTGSNRQRSKGARNDR